MCTGYSQNKKHPLSDSTTTSQSCMGYDTHTQQHHTHTPHTHTHIIIYKKNDILKNKKHPLSDSTTTIFHVWVWHTHIVYTLFTHIYIILNKTPHTHTTRGT